MAEVMKVVKKASMKFQNLNYLLIEEIYKWYCWNVPVCRCGHGHGNSSIAVWEPKVKAGLVMVRIWKYANERTPTFLQ